MHTGDLAVEAIRTATRDQGPRKDIIHFGGENISSVEVEIALYRHPRCVAACGAAVTRMGREPLRIRAAQARTDASADEDHRHLPRSARDIFKAAEVGSCLSVTDHRTCSEQEIHVARASTCGVRSADARNVVADSC